MNYGPRLLFAAGATAMLLSTAGAQVANQGEGLGQPVDDETVKKLLLQRGWQLDRGPQGDWILRRGATPPAMPQPPARATSQNETSAEGRPADDETVRNLLQQRGWRLDRTPQGDWILRRGSTSSAIPLPPVGTPQQSDTTVTWQPVDDETVKNLLQQRGWQLDRTPQGDWMLRRGSTSSAIPQPSVGTPQQSDTTVTWQPVDDETVKNLLQQRGWQLDRTPQGDWILRRGTIPPVTSQPPAQATTRREAIPAWQPSSIEQLRELLVPHGWRIEQETDGSVLLFPEVNTVAPSRQVPPPAPSRIADAPPSPPSQQTREPETDDSDQLRDLLRAHGLHIERDPQGGVIIYPIAEPAPKPEPKPAAPEITTVARPPVQPSVEPVLEIIQQHGWGVDREADGSLILTPPEEKPDTTTKEPDPSTTATAEDERCTGVSLATFSLEDVDLPVNSESEATIAAQRWIEHQALDGMTAGRVRRILRVYLVSIVDEKQPHVLRNQLSIRRADGCMTPLL